MSDAKKKSPGLKKILTGLVIYGALLVCISLVYLLFAEDIALYISFVYRLIPAGAAVLVLYAAGRLVFGDRFLWGLGERFLVWCLWAGLGFFLLVGILAGVAHRTEPEEGFSVSTPFFSGKNVLVFAPHQDDELNLAGGILEQYLAAGSHVSVVFSTNGDCYNPAEVRVEEALSAMALLGIGEEDVYFLGFGDSWQPQLQGDAQVSHIYNCGLPGTRWISAAGNTHCYGTDRKAPWLDGEYTRENYLTGIQTLIAQKLPDVIFCVDHDSHPDHKALDLFFEEAMGKVLAEVPDYAPRVFKGFCYGTAWGAEDDFSSGDNLQSTKKPDDNLWQVSGLSYDWDARFRIPVSAENLNRILTENTVYQALQKHFSQNAYYHGGRILNTDKVFWERRTDSLLYGAAVFADGVPVQNLNDFKLRDSRDLTENRFPEDGVCDASLIRVQLAQPERMTSIVLYDNPNPHSNILAGYLELPDGSRLEFGPLNSTGGASEIRIPEQELDHFQIYITRTEGDCPGLTEMEAYGITGEESEWFLPVDARDNLAADYWVESGDSAEFRLYADPKGRAVSLEDLEIRMDSDGSCSWELVGGRLVVHCPEGAEAMLTLKGEQMEVCFRVSNPRPVSRAGMRLLQWADRHTAFAVEAIVYLLDLAAARITSVF